MGQVNQSGEIVLLFDTYSGESKKLYEAFLNIGEAVYAVCIEDNGFLPDGITSVFGYFLGDFQNEKADALGKPRYFNELSVPPYWEIESSNSSGKVLNYNKERARIFYTEPTSKRQIRLVDWLDENGVVRLCEHYNKYGAIFCKTAFNKKGEKVTRSFFSAEGKETIVENFVTGDVILTKDGRDMIFHGKREFVWYFFRAAGLEQKSVYYNSLSYPFFASLDLPENGRRDILFWSEDIAAEIPGNMQLILRGAARRTGKICVQKRTAYEKLIALNAPADMVQRGGYVYSFVRENRAEPNVLICTNSDNIEGLTELVTALPELHFHIAALTEMSQKLHGCEKYENVSLYPGAKRELLAKLFKMCDYYFDINHGGEIVDAVHQAFLNNMAIFGIEECIHNRNFIAAEQIFEQTKLSELIAAVRATVQDKDALQAVLQKQREHALTLDETAFRSLFE